MFPSVKCHSTEALARLDLVMRAQHNLGATLHTLFCVIRLITWFIHDFGEIASAWLSFHTGISVLEGQA